MITRLGLEIEGFFVVRGTAKPPPDGMYVDGSYALLEVRTKPHDNAYDLLADTMRSIHAMREEARKHKGMFVMRPRMNMSGGDYVECQRKINVHGKKEIHGAEATSLDADAAYRNSTYNQDTKMWSLWAATHINVCRSESRHATVKGCDKCGRYTPQELVFRYLTKAYLAAYYDRLQAFLPKGMVDGRMIRHKDFGAELRSISTFDFPPSAANLYRFCDAIFKALPYEELA